MWPTLGRVSQSLVDASVVQDVRWEGASALADWASLERWQTQPACVLGGGGAARYWEARPSGGRQTRDMSMVTPYNPDSVFPPYAAYAHAVEVPPGARTLYVSGLNGYEPDGRTMPPDFAGQARWVWRHLADGTRRGRHDVRRPGAAALLPRLRRGRPRQRRADPGAPRRPPGLPRRSWSSSCSSPSGGSRSRPSRRDAWTDGAAARAPHRPPGPRAACRPPPRSSRSSSTRTPRCCADHGGQRRLPRDHGLGRPAPSCAPSPSEYDDPARLGGRRGRVRDQPRGVARCEVRPGPRRRGARPRPPRSPPPARPVGRTARGR